MSSGAVGLRKFNSFSMKQSQSFSPQKRQKNTNSDIESNFTSTKGSRLGYEIFQKFSTGGLGIKNYELLT